MYSSVDGGISWKAHGSNIVKSLEKSYLNYLQEEPLVIRNLHINNNIIYVNIPHKGYTISVDNGATWRDLVKYVDTKDYTLDEYGDFSVDVYLLIKNSATVTLLTPEQQKQIDDYWIEYKRKKAAETAVEEYVDCDFCNGVGYIKIVTEDPKKVNPYYDDYLRSGKAPYGLEIPAGMNVCPYCNGAKQLKRKK